MGACHWKVPNKVSRWFTGWREASDSPRLPFLTSADVMDTWAQTVLFRAIQGVLQETLKTQLFPWEMMRTKNINYIIFTKVWALERWEPKFFRESCCSVAKFCLTLCDPHELQHTRPPYPSLSPWVCSDSGPLSQWWDDHLIFCSPFLLLPSAFPSIRVFFNESALRITWKERCSFSSL